MCGPNIALVSTMASDGGEKMHSDFTERHMLVLLIDDKMKSGFDLPETNFLDHFPHLWICKGQF